MNRVTKQLLEEPDFGCFLVAFYIQAVKKIFLNFYQTRPNIRITVITVSMNVGKQFFRTTFVFRLVDFVGSGIKYVLTYVLGS